MKKSHLRIILKISICSFLFSCAGMPESINDIYISEKTQDESNILHKIEQSIIIKKQEKDETEANYAIAGQKYSIEQKKLAILEQEQILLKDELQLCRMRKNAACIKEIEKQTIAKQKENRLQILKNNYKNCFKDNENAKVKINKSELSVLVAELNHEKSKIALRIQQKRNTPKKTEDTESQKKGIIDKIFGSSEEKTVDVKKFEIFLNQCRKDLAIDQKDQIAVLDELNKSLTLLKKSGYNGEL